VNFRSGREQRRQSAILPPSLGPVVAVFPLGDLGIAGGIRDFAVGRGSAGMVEDIGEDITSIAILLQG